MSHTAHSSRAGAPRRSRRAPKTPEGALLKLVLDYLAAEHILAFRMNVLAMPTGDGKRFIKAGVPGMSDILAFHGGTMQDGYAPYSMPIVPIWIELKAPKGKQSELQASFQQQVEEHGHRYVLAYSLEDVKEALR